MWFIDWFIGPQLLGLIFLIASFLQMRFPPKKINDFYGYRSPASKQNQQTWDEANRYSNNLMIRLAFILIVTGFVFTFILHLIAMSRDASILFLTGLMIACALLTVVVLITRTEKHLKQTFGK